MTNNPAENSNRAASKLGVITVALFAIAGAFEAAQAALNNGISLSCVIYNHRYCPQNKPPVPPSSVVVEVLNCPKLRRTDLKKWMKEC